MSPSEAQRFCWLRMSNFVLPPHMGRNLPSVCIAYFARQKAKLQVFFFFESEVATLVNPFNSGSRNFVSSSNPSRATKVNLRTPEPNESIDFLHFGVRLRCSVRVPEREGAFWLHLTCQRSLTKKTFLLVGE